MRRKEMKAIWNAVCWEKQRRLSGFKSTPLCLPSIKRLACLLLQIFPQGGGCYKGEKHIIKAFYTT